LKRILPVTSYSKLPALAKLDAALFVDGMAVKSEQNSSTEYIATMDFTFSAEAIRKHLRANGIPFIDTQADPVVLVPVTKSDGTDGATATLKPGLGSWGRTWKSLDLSNSITPLRVAALSSGVGPAVISKLETGADGAARDFASNYGSTQTVAAIAQHDPGAQKLKVTLTGRDAVGPFSLKRSYPILDGDLAYTLEYAAVVSQGILEGRWKAVKSRRIQADGLGQPLQPVSIEVYFRSPAQWYEIEGQLRNLPGLQGFRTEGVSARSADIAFQYPGGGQQLQSALSQQGFSLTPAGQRWVLQKTF
ncbi:MAG: DUF2066 domain-containing protein, partial [Pseudomonadota bacterium]